MHDPDLIERNVRTKALAARDENELDLTDARAHKLVMVTSVDRVALDYGQPAVAGQDHHGPGTPVFSRRPIPAGIDGAEDRGGNRLPRTPRRGVHYHFRGERRAAIGDGGTHIVAAWHRTALDFVDASGDAE